MISSNWLHLTPEVMGSIAMLHTLFIFSVKVNR